MNFSTVKEDRANNYLSITVIGLFILGTLQVQGVMVLIKVQRFIFKVLAPICLLLCHMLHLVSSWPLNLLLALFRCSPRLNPQLLRRLRQDLITTLVYQTKQIVTNLVIFSGKNVDAQKQGTKSFKNTTWISITVTKLIFRCLFYFLNQFWKKVWQRALSTRYFQLSKTQSQLSSAKVDVKPTASIMPKPQHLAEPEFRGTRTIYAKRASPKLHLRPFPGLIHDLDEET